MTWMRWLKEMDNVVEASATVLQQPGATMAAALQQLAHVGVEFGRTWHGLFQDKRLWTPVTVQPASSTALSTMAEAVMTVVKWAWRSQEAQPHAAWARKMELDNLAAFTWISSDVLRDAGSAPTEPQVAVLLLRLALAVHRTTLLVGTEAPIQVSFPRGQQRRSMSKPSAAELAAAVCPQLRWACTVRIQLVDATARTIYEALRDMVAEPQSAAATAATASDPEAVPPEAPSMEAAAPGAGPTMDVLEDIPPVDAALSAACAESTVTAAVVEPIAVAAAAAMDTTAAVEPASHDVCVAASPAAAIVDLEAPGDMATSTDAVPMDVVATFPATDATSSAVCEAPPVHVASVEPLTIAAAATPVASNASALTRDLSSPPPTTLRPMPARGFDAVHALVLMSFSAA
ncbi:MAG: hypothetical protein ACKVQA_26250, partial [Burkholderiales bacterium]